MTTFRTHKKTKKATRKPSVSRTLMACATHATESQKAFGSQALQFARRMHAMGYDLMHAYCVYVGARCMLRGAKADRIKTLAAYARADKARRRSQSRSPRSSSLARVMMVG